MGTDTKDLVLEQAPLSEERLRRLLAARGSAELTRAKSASAPVGASPDGADALVEDVFHEIEEPDGTVAWAVRIAPDAGASTPLPDEGVSMGPAVIDALAKAVPLIAQAIRLRRVFEVIGPPEVLAGLKAGSLVLTPAKSGGLLGAVRAAGGGRIIAQARFAPVKLVSAIGPQVAFALVSAAVGQVHMAEITRELAAINSKLDRVIEAQQAERHGRLAGAIERIAELSAAFRETGAVSDDVYARLVAAEGDLRATRNELLHLHQGYMRRTESLAGGTLAPFNEALKSLRATELHDASLLLAAEATMLELERLLRARAAGRDGAGGRPRVYASEGERAARLEAILAATAHLQRFDEHCREALDRERAKHLRMLSVGLTERVAANLANDRGAVAEFYARARRVFAGGNEARVASVLRVDARGGELRVRALALGEG